MQSTNTYNTTGTGAPAGTGAYGSQPSTTIGTGHPSTGDKVASMVPGTEQNKEKKALDNQYGTTGAHHTGGVGSTTTTNTGYGAPGHTTSTGYGGTPATTTGGAYGSHQTTTTGAGHPSAADKVASMVPGTEQNKEKKLEQEYGTSTTGGTGYGASSTTHTAGHTGHHAGHTEHTGHHAPGAAGLGHSTTGTHASTTADTHTHGTHGAHTHGTHTGPATGAGVAGTGVGTGVGSGTHGTHTDTTHHAGTGTHGHHAHDSTTKPSMADKIGGKIDVAVGKMTHNEGKVVQGEIKQTEGKAGLANAGLGAGAPGTHTTH
ncbi:hypothetical protein C6P46_000852 [Rhodotorula mucilaginosa]|uniref:Uncharacterized protein n=1 Tax=Rhodotorula mucilaginosa TaxID=5537 RepID=A0A9P7B2V9_RHOMI|nr:hypothetical protein C6P46_000852 [Rhodotorula mucilaginosa]